MVRVVLDQGDYGGIVPRSWHKLPMVLDNYFSFYPKNDIRPSAVHFIVTALSVQVSATNNTPYTEITAMPLWSALAMLVLLAAIVFSASGVQAE